MNEYRTFTHGALCTARTQFLIVYRVLKSTKQKLTNPQLWFFCLFVLSYFCLCAEIAQLVQPTFLFNGCGVQILLTSVDAKWFWEFDYTRKRIQEKNINLLCALPPKSFIYQSFDDAGIHWGVAHKPFGPSRPTGQMELCSQSTHVVYSCCPLETTTDFSTQFFGCVVCIFICVCASMFHSAKGLSNVVPWL